MNFLILLPNRKAKYYWIDAGLFICGLILLLMSKWIPAVLMLLMAAMGYLTRRKPYIHFSENGVKVHLVWVKHYNWIELNAVLLKDGMLTMDFSNNRLYQEAIHEQSSSTINESIFNKLCAEKIALAKKES